MPSFLLKIRLVVVVVVVVVVIDIEIVINKREFVAVILVLDWMYKLAVEAEVVEVVDHQYNNSNNK